MAIADARQSGPETPMLIRRLMMLAVMAGSASSVFAQTTTTTTTPTTTTSGNSGVGGANTGFTNQGMQAAPQITGNGSTGAQVNGTNIFAGFYANPTYQGQAGSNGVANPGGFGTALSGGSGSSASRSGTSTLQNRSATGSTQSRSTGSTGTGTTGTSSLGSSTGATGSPAFGTTGNSAFGNTGTGSTGRTGASTTGFGNSATSGFGNTRNSMFGGSSQSQPGVVIAQVSPVRYTASVRITAPPIAPAKLTTDLSASLARSSFLTSARGIQVSMDAGQVVLRGTVKDEEEARTAEGIVRLTPGVRDVKNELQFPKP